MIWFFNDDTASKQFEVDLDKGMFLNGRLGAEKRH